GWIRCEVFLDHAEVEGSHEGELGIEQPVGIGRAVKKAAEDRPSELGSAPLPSLCAVRPASSTDDPIIADAFRIQILASDLSRPAYPGTSRTGHLRGELAGLVVD